MVILNSAMGNTGADDSDRWFIRPLQDGIILKFAHHGSS